MTSNSEAAFKDDAKLVQQAVLAVYGMDVLDVREVVRGVNRTFSICEPDARTYFLRLYRTHGRSEDEIDAELRLLERVEQDEVLAVSPARPTREGARSCRIALSDGVIRRAALFDAAAGRPLEMTPDDVCGAANALKRLHGQQRLSELAPRRQVADLGDAYRALSRLADQFSFAGPVVAATRERCKYLAAAGWPAAGMPVGFCHGDFRIANMRIDGCRITLFDFDDCGRGPQWFDLATVGWWLEIEGKSEAASLWRAFVNAYMPTLLASPSFRHAIPLLILLNEINSIRFLLDYCALTDDLWREVCRRLDDLSFRAVSGQLAIGC